MRDTKYGFSCSNCTTISFPIPKMQALEYTNCPHCGEIITSKSDYVYWKCDKCEAHNDYDSDNCYSCGNSRD